MIRQTLTNWIEQALQRAKADGALDWRETPLVELEAPKQKEHGDYACNAAMLVAKQARLAPRDAAELLIRRLPAESSDWIDRVEVAGPGFLNFFLKPGWAGQIVRHALTEGERFGSSNIGQGVKTLVEFVSANPTGPLSVAHGRNAVIGDCLVRLLNFSGYQADAEFYVNDAVNSTQIQNFAASVIVRFKQLIGQEAEMPEDAYHGEYVTEVAQAILDQQGPSAIDDDPLLRFQTWSEEAIKRQQEEDLRDFGVLFKRWFSERELHDSGAVERALATLRESGYAYEADGALWLRSTAFGDEKDRTLVRSNGLPTYLAGDAAYHLDKYQRGYQRLIDVWGPDHHGYIARMKAVVGAFGHDPDSLEVLVHQIVRLFKDGAQVRMSKRAGDIITLRETMDEAGVDATRFFYLLRSHDSPLDFDLDLATRQTDENPVYYVQYGHARLCSLLQKAEEKIGRLPDWRDADLSLLQAEAEGELAKKLADFPDETRTAAERLSPHRIANYALELSRALHHFYAHCPVLAAESEALRDARICLCLAARQTLRNALSLLGVSAPERMAEREEEH